MDIFFVIGGYLLIQQLLSQFKDNSFNYWSFIFRKLVRLWPLILLASVVSLAAGYFLMLPDDYENLAESAIASSVFANNILQCITTKNYWDVVNLYKPLMHLWYIGILMQAYVVLPVVFMMLKYILGDAGKGIFAGTIGIAVISLILYLAPFFTTAWKFYYLPFRLFEMTAGGLIVFADLRLRIKQKKICVTCAITVMLVMLCSRTEIVSPSFMLLVTSGAAVIFVGCMKNFEFQNQIVTKIVNYGSIIGKYSYSIYIWHQIIVAFLFYSVFPKRDIKSFVVFAVMTIIISMISYHLIEVLLGQTLRSKKMEKIIIAGSTFAAAILCGVSFFIYNHAGGHNVPELGINKNNVHHNMHAEYCDRPYSWNKAFENDGRQHILVLGNSFGRDWANILYEWNHSLDISYLYYTEETFNKHDERIELADIIFYVKGPGYEEVPENILEIDRGRLYIVGNKNYGESNGIIFSHRKTDYYFEQTADIPDGLLEENEREKIRYGNRYIDMITPVLCDDGRVKVFTDDKMFISQDCRHLTQAGAKYYARILDMDQILALK